LRRALQKSSLAYRTINAVVPVGFTAGWVALAITALER
jgi:hypothetical protein